MNNAAIYAKKQQLSYKRTFPRDFPVAYIQRGQVISRGRISFLSPFFRVAWPDLQSPNAFSSHRKCNFDATRFVSLSLRKKRKFAPASASILLTRPFVCQHSTAPCKNGKIKNKCISMAANRLHELCVLDRHCIYARFLPFFLR